MCECVRAYDIKCMRLCVNACVLTGKRLNARCISEPESHLESITPFDWFVTLSTPSFPCTVKEDI